MDPEKKVNQEKKVYKKPVITKVELIAEEAVLSACKGGGLQGNCSVTYTCNSEAGS
jgi:hypothetical protein